jgi:putative MATE family efflux protein
MANDVLIKQLLRDDEDSVSSLEITRTVLALSAPVVLEMLLQSMVGFADTAMLGWLPDGGAALAGVSLANNVHMFALTVFTAVGTGSTALVARSIGAGDDQAANKVLVQSLMCGGLLAIAVMLAGVLYPNHALRLMGAQDEAREHGAAYLRIVSWASVPLFAMPLLTGCLRGAGDTRTPMYINGGMNVLNVTLNYLLIYGNFGFPELGVAGAALATSISRAVGALIMFVLLVAGRLRLSLGRVRDVSVDIPLIRRIMNIGIPAAAEIGLMRGAQLLFARLVATLGTTAVAAHTVALNCESISFMPGFGIGMAGAAMVAQSVGAGRFKLAERFGRESLKIAVLSMSALGVVLFTVPGALSRLFIKDPEVVELSAVCLRIVAISQPALATTMTMSNILRTVGDTRRMLFITVAGFWLIRVPVGYALVMFTGLGLAGAWIGMNADLFFRGIVTFLRFRSGRWKSVKV